MNIKELIKYQETLEKKYDELNRKIQDKTMEEQEKIKNDLSKLDEQLDLLDDIIQGFYEVPKKYNQLIELKKKYENILQDN